MEFYNGAEKKKYLGFFIEFVLTYQKVSWAPRFQPLLNRNGYFFQN